jgi:NAD-reducing hydrogenase large subunit
LIEILAGLERIGRLIDDPDIRATHLRADAGINQTEGVGISEAPRGTLIHHYQVDSHGLISRMNLIIATGQNNLAMNRTVKQIAQHYILPEHQAAVPEGMLNRIEAGIRAFDPCLSCSTHALGQMPMHVSVVNCEGEVVAERSR